MSSPILRMVVLFNPITSLEWVFTVARFFNNFKKVDEINANDLRLAVAFGYQRRYGFGWQR